MVQENKKIGESGENVAPCLPEQETQALQELPKCKQCGAELQEGQDFCTSCGYRAAAAVDANVNPGINQINPNVNAGINQINPNVNAGNYPFDSVDQSNKKKKKILPIILSVVAVAVAAILFFVFKGPSVESITLSEENIKLKIDESAKITCTIAPERAKKAKVTWESSNESVAVVSEFGEVTAKSEGSCVITAKAGKITATLAVTVKAGPDFKEIFDKYCDYTWAECGEDGSYLYVDTNPSDLDNKGLAYLEAYEAVKKIIGELELPDSLLNDMERTCARDGKQTRTFEYVTATWSYHPDEGLEVNFKLN